MNKKFMWLNKTAFTMAEILLSLTIIGIVAAITLPSLTANFQDKAFNAKRQALHARLTQAFRTIDYSEYMPLYSGYEEPDENGNYNLPNINKFMDELSHSLSIKVVSDPEMIFGPSKNNGTDWKSLWVIIAGWWYREHYFAYFQTVNGESIGINFLNPAFNDKNHPGGSLCFILMYDLNGAKGPNKIGKDLGLMGAYYSDKMELYAPMLGAITSNMENENYDPGDSNSQKYKYPDYRLASPEELLLLFTMNMNDFFSSGHQIEYAAPFCTIDGHKYSFDSLNRESLYNPSEGEYQEQEMGRRDDDGGDCLYMLVTSDGSAPKGGITYDINSED